jgi:hypothetical protein
MTDEWTTFDRVFLGGTFLAFLTGPTLLLLLRGEYVTATAAFLSPVGILLGIQAGVYEFVCPDGDRS